MIQIDKLLCTWRGLQNAELKAIVSATEIGMPIGLCVRSIAHVHRRPPRGLESLGLDASTAKWR